MAHTKDVVKCKSTGKINIIIYPDNYDYKYNKFHELVERTYVSHDEFLKYQSTYI